MSIQIENDYGKIDITNETIARVVGEATVECYGVVGMASRHQIRDGLTEILRKENFSRGVVVRNAGADTQIDLYLIVGYGTKITEVSYQVQSKVRYTLKKILGLTIDSVNIYVQGVRVTNL
ncbi:Asp23/Gls24 family envelope stress response protein [Sporosarcina aquimarina]|uniref:Asp23/Gls24 family envelope stress response protein n=1 Tax=Sporosarcina aquimarina TaxID=114975 RepID=A0ABU4FYW5_9BACL|nr:Asp23/Gls24 family envelope stress response protein [Sporosarcina aquimarina]MDW0109270.1 Asp23/Gls24 family envelope stress response protein [Sporosarcina aquimarina]